MELTLVYVACGVISAGVLLVFLGLAWHLMGTDQGQRASGQRSQAATADGRHVHPALASRPPAAITDDPDTGGFWPARKPWDSGITAAVPVVRNARNA